MLHNIKRLIPFTYILFSAAAHAITCPPESQIKAAIFTSAIVYDQQEKIWELLSAPFTHDGVTWNLVYGLEIPSATSEADAIRLGQQSYKSALIVHKKPHADPIPGHVFCDYTNPNMTYWIQALSPPGQ